MLYTVQNAGGEVYGGWPLPTQPEYTAEEWAERLHGHLADIEGVNGIAARPLPTQTGEDIGRVVVDIDPSGDEAAKLARVHRTVGMIASGA